MSLQKLQERWFTQKGFFFFNFLGFFSLSSWSCFCFFTHNIMSRLYWGISCAVRPVQSLKCRDQRRDGCICYCCGNQQFVWNRDAGPFTHERDTSPEMKVSGQRQAKFPSEDMFSLLFGKPDCIVLDTSKTKIQFLARAIHRPQAQDTLQTTE